MTPYDLSPEEEDRAFAAYMAMFFPGTRGMTAEAPPGPRVTIDTSSPATEAEDAQMAAYMAAHFGGG